MRTIAISLGGSIIHPESGFNVNYVKPFCGIIRRERGIKFVISVGGGHAARTAIGAVVWFTPSSSSLDVWLAAVCGVDRTILMLLRSLMAF